MQRRGNLTYLILAIVITLVATLLMVCVNAEAQIAFASDRVGNPEIYVMDTDGRNQRRLTNHPARDNSPAWSPDGKQIAFVSRAFEFDGEVHFRGDGPSADIYVMGADGGNLQNLTANGGSDYSPSWSPDGKRIAFSSDKDERWNYEIYVMDPDGGNLQKLTNEPLADRYPSWSPDGKQIVFSARRFGHVETKFSITNEIYVMDADGVIKKDSLKMPGMTGTRYGRLMANESPSWLIRRGTFKILESTLWTRMGVMNNNSRIIRRGTALPHGHPTADGLPSYPIGMGTVKST